MGWSEVGLVLARDPRGEWRVALVTRGLAAVLGTSACHLIGEAIGDALGPAMAVPLAAAADQVVTRGRGSSCVAGIGAGKSEPFRLEPLLGDGQRVLARLVPCGEGDEASLTDLLTGLANRRGFIAGLERELKRLGPDGMRRLAVVLVDIDRFRLINDAAGPAAGDQLLVALARRLLGEMPDAEVVARLQADEFALVVPHGAQPTEGASLYERVQTLLGVPFGIKGRSYRVEASVGIARMPEDGLDAEALLRGAGLALSQAKTDGGGTFRYYARAFDREVHRRVSLGQDLRRALVGGEIQPHFQPIVRLRDGHPLGVEALARWHRPDGVAIGPDEFIPLAEEVGMIGRLSAQIFSQSARAIRGWREAGLPAMRISINVSPLQFAHDGFVALVADALRESGLAPELLELELTESTMMRNIERSLRVMGRLKDLGVSLAVDDFGTGYSSLSYLKRLPADRIKIDRSFAAQIDRDAGDLAIVQAIIHLAHRFRMVVVGEGIETAAQAEILAREGCDEGQGYYFGRPMPQADLATYLSRRAPVVAPA